MDCLIWTIILVLPLGQRTDGSRDVTALASALQSLS